MLVFSTGNSFFCRSAASAPAFRICSTVSVAEADFFSRTWNFVCVAVSDSKSVTLERGATRSGAFDFGSRATTTSCARSCPAMASPQSNTVEDFFNTKSGVINEFGAIGKRLIAKPRASLRS